MFGVNTDQSQYRILHQDNLKLYVSNETLEKPNNLILSFTACALQVLFVIFFKRPLHSEKSIHDKNVVLTKPNKTNDIFVFCYTTIKAFYSPKFSL